MDELTTKRLAVIKQLYLQGVNQSYDSEPMNGFCLLSFHDSVEMYMKLCAEIRGARVKRDTNFGDYFTLLPDLLGQSTMTNLNSKRVNLKHHGSLPSKLDVETSRVNVTDFFEQNTPIFFEAEFGDISLISLLKYDSVKEYMSKSLECLDSEDFENSILNSQIAFMELLFHYKQDKSFGHTSPFKINEHFFHSDGKGIDNSIDKFVDKTKKSLSNISDMLSIIGFGIDYIKLYKFKILSPHIQQWAEREGNRYDHLKDEKIIYNKRNAQFCFDFVIESSLQLQRFDFDISELRTK
ncbi:MAG: hypothetical protein SNH27_11030 [Rikenellaceae bacterium]